VAELVFISLGQIFVTTIIVVAFDLCEILVKTINVVAVVD